MPASGSSLSPSPRRGQASFLQFFLGQGVLLFYFLTILILYLSHLQPEHPQVTFNVVPGIWKGFFKCRANVIPLSLVGALGFFWSIYLISTLGL